MTLILENILFSLNIGIIYNWDEPNTCFLTLACEMVRLSTGCAVSNSWISSITWASVPRITTRCSQPFAAAHREPTEREGLFSHIFNPSSLQCNRLIPPRVHEYFMASVKTYIFNMDSSGPLVQYKTTDKHTPLLGKAARLKRIDMICTNTTVGAHHIIMIQYNKLTHDCIAVNLNINDQHKNACDSAVFHLNITR